MIGDYLRADGAPGWIFSVDRNVRPVERKRDLCAHAFVLFALAHLLRLEKSTVFIDALEDTLAVIDGAFADSADGLHRDCLPRADDLRRQNPHMHLFEAWLALYETTGAEEFLQRARIA
jgi:mannose/cellobiose epimerase-like protein (N-acyl-D-glucosamine 2-epimerase family)